jgi:hypothetical protein
MMGFLFVSGAVAALCLGVWIGVGAPGWPSKPGPRDARSFRRRYPRRSLNPVDWRPREHRRR